MKKINLVNLELEIDRDSINTDDDYEHRLVECLSGVVDTNNVVNLVKVKLGDRLTKEELYRNMNFVKDVLYKMGATNCVFVPIIKGYIEDITVDHIEVKHELNNESSSLDL